LASSKSLIDAYLSAGYRAKKRDTASSAATRLAAQPAIIEALDRLKAERARVRAEATRIAIEHSGITQARVAVELGRIGFANIIDYADIFGATEDLGAWLKKLPREQAAALTGVWLTTSGQVRFTLGDKRAALMDVAKLFGWIVEKRENKIVDEFDSMTPEQIEAWLDERAEARVKLMQRSRGPRTHRRQPSGGIRTPRPTTAPGKPH